MNMCGYIAAAGCFLYFLGVVALVILRAKKLSTPRLVANTPFVSIIKPLKGIDEGLKENLVSFFTIDYPSYEIIFGVEDKNDPAIKIVDEIIKDFPHVKTKVATDQIPDCANPKVRNILRMMKHARGQLIIISDSNIRVESDYIKKSVLLFDDKDTALVSHFIAGRGEKSVGAILDHLHICGFIAPAQSFATIYGRIKPVIGKSMVIRRRHLEEIGGIRELADFLAEDYLLGRKFAKAKRKVKISPWTVTNYNENASIFAFLSRHYRWLSMRWRINPFTCILEILAIPTLWNFLWAITTKSFLLPVTVFSIHLLLQQIAVMVMRGREPLPLRSIFLSIIKDGLHLFLLIASLGGNRVEWRGNYFKIGWKTRLTPSTPPEPVSRFKLSRYLFSARMGDMWPAR